MNVVSDKEKDVLVLNEDGLCKKLMFRLETFCSLVNCSEYFDVDCCEDGFLEFFVPLDWLMNYLNEEQFAHGKKTLKIKNIEDLNNWHAEECSYYETEFIFRKSEEDGICISPVVCDCKYCEDFYKNL